MSGDLDARQLNELGVELGRIAARSVPVLTEVYRGSADMLVEKWAANARTSSGVHGKHYPESIDHQRLISSDIAFEVGPNPSKPQGSMAFETGSAKQPPHPDGQQAADQMQPDIEQGILAALAELGL
jgi:hypothetical protein